MREALKTEFDTEDSKAERSTVHQQSGISTRPTPEGEGEDWTEVVAVAAVVDAERDAQARRPGGCNVRQPGDRRKRFSSETVRRPQCETARGRESRSGCCNAKQSGERRRRCPSCGQSDGCTARQPGD